MSFNNPTTPIQQTTYIYGKVENFHTSPNKRGLVIEEHAFDTSIGELWQAMNLKPRLDDIQRANKSSSNGS